MRKARSVAWFSTTGFHQRSKCTTCDAAVRVRPEPPAFSDRTKNGIRSSERLALATSISPCSVTPGRPKMLERNAASGSITSRELGEDQHLVLTRRDHLAIYRRRAYLPLSCSCHPWSPSHCERRLQICFSRIK